MKSILVVTAILLGANAALAQEQIIKECSTSAKQMDTGTRVDSKIQIISKAGTLSARTTQTMDGMSTTFEESAKIVEDSVRENLPTDVESPEIGNLNQAESMIAHALMLTNDPIFEGEFSAGFDLTKVRSAKLYVMGEVTNMGASAIVEARDAKNQLLGSFLGGFLVSPCK